MTSPTTPPTASVLLTTDMATLSRAAGSSLGAGVWAPATTCRARWWHPNRGGERDDDPVARRGPDRVPGPDRPGDRHGHPFHRALRAREGGRRRPDGTRAGGRPHRRGRRLARTTSAP